ncbi:MAG: MFS transporter [Alphaproteobacteria bacterium]
MTTAPTPSPRTANYVLGVLFLGYVSNSVDRGILSILNEPLRHEFHLSNTELGLLGGLAFALFYSVLGLPIAALADRTNRRNVLAISIALWSVATAVCGGATSYLTLLAARIGTAIGEAGGTPPSNALIADYFPRERRATALSIYALAIPIGAMIGSFGGGWANVFLGWRWTFVLAGAPGLLIAALLFLTVSEPKRTTTERAPSVLYVIRHLWDKRSFRQLSLGAALHSFVYYGAANFGVSFFMRSHHMNTGEAGNWLALFNGIAAIGTFFGGYLADLLSQRHGDPRWYLRIPGISILVMVPFQLVSYLSNDLSVFIPAFIIATIFNSVYFGPTAAMTQALATPRMRAVAASVLLFIQTIIGLSFGPTVVGAISDALTPSFHEEALRYALVITSLVNIWSAIHYFVGARHARQDVETTDALATRV